VRINDFYQGLKDLVPEYIQGRTMKVFVPTGSLEPAIIEIGKSIHGTTIINIQTNNKSGKTCLGANIIKNIMFENDPLYFDYPLFRDWPFKNADGEPIKRGRIVGTPQNTKSTGPIREEILKWFPSGRFTSVKAGKGYFSEYTTDTDWLFDVMTFNQDPDEFEGRMIAWHWIDEPARPELVEAFTARHSHGGILIFTETPLRAGPMLDTIDELKEKGTRVIKISATANDNSCTDGKLNSKGTKRGLQTNAEIEAWKKTVSPGQWDARVLGINLSKEGKVYKKFTEIAHVRHFDEDDERFLLANCYCCIDYHEKFYPFISWWAVFPPDSEGRFYRVCYNEWPSFDWFREWYHKKRNNEIYSMTVKDLSAKIMQYDNTHLGYHILKRGIDPGFAGKTAIVDEFSRYGIKIEVPHRDRVEVMRNKIMTEMDYVGEHSDLSFYNEPSWYIMPHCKNMIRSFKFHYWLDDEKLKNNKGQFLEIESETYKDPIDTARIFESLVIAKEYEPPNTTLAKKKVILPSSDIQIAPPFQGGDNYLLKGMRDISI